MDEKEVNLRYNLFREKNSLRILKTQSYTYLLPGSYFSARIVQEQEIQKSLSRFEISYKLTIMEITVFG